MHTVISTLIQAMPAHDELEQQHIAATLAWIASGASLFRVRKPDIPLQHLVSYFVLVDLTHGKLLLVDHRISGLWLLAGGHVEPDEHPQATVCREATEELGITASFLFAAPFFLTITQTVGTVARHTDVSLWYVLHGDSTEPLAPSTDEFYAAQWFTFADIPFSRSDPHMRRFTRKLRARLANAGATIQSPYQ